MDDLVAVGDVHEGIAFPLRVDPHSGVSERALDLHRNFQRAATHAVERGAKLFVVLGDLFERPHVPPVFREMVRRDVVEPLGEAGVEVWFLAGNHDQPRSEARSTSLDDFRGYRHVKIVRRPTAETREFGGKKVTFLLLPYLHPEQVLNLVKERLGQDISRDSAHEYASAILKQWMENRVREDQADLTVLMGHYYVEGARTTSLHYPMYLPGEFTVTRGMIPDEVDLGLFGHIHVHQVLHGKLVYAGSPERVDWGERGDEKGFLAVDLPTGRWRFENLPCRPMLQVEVDVSTEADPTAKILASLPPSPEGAMVRLLVTTAEGGRAAVDERRVLAALAETFDAKVEYREVEREALAPLQTTLDPLQLFEDFVVATLREHPRVEDVKREGKAILREVLS